ncbi:hypothetical protein DC522_29545 [Microvirga sp. KLBC 81]|uniref:hypothetical protein n=1 Tax=Microvirga sp. KLBC 81 TaxID=1862707 RepID=UPI000D51CDDB|nr:hypothetical protein [Microvirga sp. KLBC 81]PVE20905.1 hypothetical protein DC522_29545 [Microvirga sp. KLBC 81]
MVEVGTGNIAVGDKVRVHFHPPGAMKSFFEGVVTRVDVPTSEGHVFVVELTHEVILDRERHIRPGVQDYVRYESRNDFPGRIEVLSEAKRAEEPPAVEPEPRGEPEIEPPVEAQPSPERFQVEIEQRPARKQLHLIAALFRRNK